MGEPLFEATLQDLKSVVCLKKGGGQFNIPVEAISAIAYDRKESSSTVGGAGRDPRAHGSKVRKPTLDITMSVRQAELFRKFVGDTGIVAVAVTRQPPDDVAVTDVVGGWYPMFGGLELKSGAPNEVKISGNALKITYDFQGAIVP